MVAKCANPTCNRQFQELARVDCSCSHRRTSTLCDWPTTAIGFARSAPQNIR